MKKSRFIWIGLIVCLFSCTREEESSEMLSAEADMEFTAIWAEQDDSRTLLQGDDGEIWWLPSEKINVFYGNAYSGQFTSTNSAPAAVTQFRGKLDYFSGDIENSSTPMSYWAVYPYDAANTCDGQSVTLRVPDVQTGVAESFADKFFPAVAQSGGADLAFYNVCGGARFSLVTSGVEKVVFRSVDGSPMAGVVKIGFNESHKPVVLEVAEPLTSIVVNAPEGGFVPGTHYFATMLPQAHAEGLEIQLLTSYKSASRVLDKPIIVRRSTFGLLEKLDEGVNYFGPELVDLGLSVKWASFNVGASAPEEYGDYFAFGETEPKEDYSWSTYKWCKGSSKTFTKYCSDSGYGYNGFTDNKDTLDPEDDAAVINLGGKWRMPTNAERYELVNNCTWATTTLNGVKGKKVTSKKEGYTDKWIFLPAAGYRDGTSLSYVGDRGFYWSSSLRAEIPYYAYGFLYDHLDVSWFSFNRSRGLSVRPVCDDPMHLVVGLKVSPNKAWVDIGDSIQLTAIVVPSNATDKRVTWSSSDASIATVDAEGLVIGVAAGTVVITATTVDGGFTAECTVMVKPELTELGKTFVPVDLGLSVKWASFNLGATQPEEYGSYYSWGEVEPKYDYSWSTYKWCMNGSGSQLTKYCNDTRYGYNGFTDGLSFLELDDDVASVLLGGGWHLPISDELLELMTQCTWTWTTLNGVYGRKVTSNKEGYTDKWIFLPAAGFRDGTSLINAGSLGSYWSSSLSTGDPRSAYYVYFNSDYVYWGNYYRSYGRSVRPVSE